MNDVDVRRSRGGAVGRAVLGMVVMAAALGVGTELGGTLVDRAGVTGLAGRLLPAALVSVIAVPLVVALTARSRRRELLGLTRWRTSLGAFALGVLVTGASAVAVLGTATALGWLSWGPLAPATFLGFVVTNGVVAVLLEALPEELTLRGLAWGSLRERFRGVVATLGTTLLFLLMPGVSTLFQAAVRLASGEPAGHLGLAPSGQDLVSYLVLLTFFGLALAAARTATASRSLWTSIATHLTFLTVNRVTFEGADRGAGWSADLATPDAVLLVPAYLLVATLVYVLVRRLRRGTGRARSS